MSIQRLAKLNNAKLCVQHFVMMKGLVSVYPGKDEMRVQRNDGSCARKLTFNVDARGEVCVDVYTSGYGKEWEFQSTCDLPALLATYL